MAPTADSRTLHLTALFGQRFVRSDLVLGAIVEAARDWPCTTAEVGRAGDPAADAVALRGIERFFHSDDLGLAEATPTDMQILVDALRVCVRPELRVAFADDPVPGVDLTVFSDIDRHNFEILDPGVPIGWAHTDAWPIEVRGVDGNDRTPHFFRRRGDLVETRETIVPIMMTTDAVVAEGDCLFYIVRPLGGLEHAE